MKINEGKEYLKNTKKGNLHQISFDFAVEGKWKFILDCADLAGNKGVSNQTGEEGIESTDVTIDLSLIHI